MIVYLSNIKFLKLLVSILLFVCVLNLGITFGSLRPKRIINGNEIKDFKPYKFVAAVLGKYGNSFSLLCGGSIIHSRFILTSAHCFYVEKGKQSMKEDMILTMGGSEFLNNNRSVNRFFRYVKKLIVHQNYTKHSHVNDLALLYLEKEFPINLDSVSVIELNKKNEFLTGKCETVGWGVDGTGVRSKVLISLSIEIIPSYACFITYEMRPSDKIICGKNMNYGSACSGDYGGPLICDGKLAGIVDSGDFNCSQERTNFLDISKYTNWLDQSMDSALRQDAVSLGEESNWKPNQRSTFTIFAMECLLYFITA